MVILLEREDGFGNDMDRKEDKGNADNSSKAGFLEKRRGHGVSLVRQIFGYAKMFLALMVPSEVDSAVDMKALKPFNI